jgi:integrase
MKNKGKADITIYGTGNILKHLTKHADLDNPQAVEAFMATKQTNAYKDHLATAYARYCQYYEINWEMPTYNREEKMPKLPTEEQINKFNAGAGKTRSLKLWISRKTGLRPVELHNLKVKDVDTTQNLTYPITAKNGSPRVLPLPTELSQAILKHIIKNNLQPTDKFLEEHPKNTGP